MREYFTKTNKKKLSLGLTSVSRAKNNITCITDILQSCCWSNRRCFVVAGGPSLEKINLDMLSNELTIGVNKAFLKLDCTINYSADERFYNIVTYWKDTNHENIHEKWKKYSLK